MRSKRSFSLRYAFLTILLSLSLVAFPCPNVHAAAKGETVGHATWSVELFTIGCGYLIEPCEMPVYRGETAAEGLLRLLCQNGFVGYYGGTPTEAFYLAYIADGTASGARYNQYVKSDTPPTPKQLSLSPAIPSLLTPYLQSSMRFFDPNDYAENWTGYIGEFVFTNGSGLMYSVNNSFPNVGFSERYLTDGDVVRVQFTLGYGADIGGMSALGGQLPNTGGQPQAGYYAVADKDALTKAMAKARSVGLTANESLQSAYANARSVATVLNASQSDVDQATRALEHALTQPDSTVTPATESTGRTEYTDKPESKTASSAALQTATPPAAEISSGTEVEESVPSETTDSEAVLPQAEATLTEAESTAAAEPDGGERASFPVGLMIVSIALPAAVLILFAALAYRKKADRGSHDHD